MKTRKISPHLSGLATAMTKLEQSDTHLTRKRAILAFRKAVRELTKTVKVEYPTMRKDGSLVAVRERRGCVCPACNAPMRSFKVLTQHINHKHAQGIRVRGIDKYMCFCGYASMHPGDLSSHLSKLKCLKTHWVQSQLLKAGGKSP